MIEDAAERFRIADLRREPQVTLGEFDCARDEYTAARQDDARREQCFAIDAFQFEVYVMKNLFEPRLDDFRHMVARDFVALLRVEFRKRDRFFFADFRRNRVAVLELHRFGHIDRGTESNGDVVRDMAAADGEHREVEEVTVFEDGERCRVGADVHDDNAEFFLFGRENGLGRGERLGDKMMGRDAGELKTADEVLQMIAPRPDDEARELEPDAFQANRVLDPALVVEAIVLRHDMEDFFVRSEDGARLGFFDDPAEIVFGHFAIGFADRDDTDGRSRKQVSTRDRARDRIDGGAGHPFSRFERAVDRLGYFFRLDDNAAPDADRRDSADADDFERPVIMREFSDDRANGRRADIKSDGVM